MEQALVRSSIGRPTILRVNGAYVYVSVHDAWYLEQRKQWRQRLAERHPDKGFSTKQWRQAYNLSSSRRSDGTRVQYLRFIRQYKRWLKEEKAWYAQYGLTVPGAFPIRTVASIRQETNVFVQTWSRTKLCVWRSQSEVEHAIKQSGGSLVHASKLMGLSRSTSGGIYRFIELYGLKDFVENARKRRRSDSLMRYDMAIREGGTLKEAAQLRGVSVASFREHLTDKRGIVWDQLKKQPRLAQQRERTIQTVRSSHTYAEAARCLGISKSVLHNRLTRWAALDQLGQDAVGWKSREVRLAEIVETLRCSHSVSAASKTLRIKYGTLKRRVSRLGLKGEVGKYINERSQYEDVAHHSHAAVGQSYVPGVDAHCV